MAREVSYSYREKIKAKRRELGLNQLQFWQEVGIGQSGGARYEGTHYPRGIPKPVRMLLELVYGIPQPANLGD